MKPRPKLFLVLITVGLVISSFGQGSGARAADPDGQIGAFGLPPPPVLKEAPAPVPARQAPLVARGIMAPPPPRDQCITKVERNAALAGTGCSCSCDAYARKPVSDRCDIACGIAYYACWNPMPTDAEADAMYMSKADPATASFAPQFSSLTQQEKDTFRGFMQLERASAWDEARQCPDE